MYDSQCLYYFAYLFRCVYLWSIIAESGLHKFGTARNTFIQIALSDNRIKKLFSCDEWKLGETTFSRAPTPSVIMNLHFTFSLKVLQTIMFPKQNFSCG